MPSQKTTTQRVETLVKVIDYYHWCAYSPGQYFSLPPYVFYRLGVRKRRIDYIACAQVPISTTL
jgi:hypothetical protein